MHGSLGHFKATILRRKQRLEKKNGKFDKKKLNYSSNKENRLDFPKPSKKELAQINSSIRDKIRRRKRNEVIVFIIIMMLLFLALFFLIEYS